MIQVACIGSRRITNEQAALCEEYGAAIARRGFILKSGGALGADLAFMRGARSEGGEVWCYLPWEGYNRQLIPDGCHLVVFDPETHSEWMDIALENHPMPKQLTHGARLLMARNTGIITESNLVIAMPAKNRKGGTEQGIRLAEKWDIPLQIIS